MIFKKRKSDKDLPNGTPGLWRKCEQCGQVIYNQEWEERFRCCPKCDYHYKLNSHERIQMLIDHDTFEEQDANLSPKDPLQFQYLETSYVQKIKDTKDKLKLNDAMILGRGKIYKKPIEIAVMDFRFLGGSMGSVVGEKFTRGVFYAIKYRIPFVVVTSSGGARMQEGMVSLMQMAKTSAALAKLDNYSIPYIVILTNPTTGGVTASFAMLGDVIMAEPGALVGFAGPRVIEQTIRQKLPAGFQLSEFQKEHGFVDMIVERKNLKKTLYDVLNYLYDW